MLEMWNPELPQDLRLSWYLSYVSSQMTWTADELIAHRICATYDFWNDTWKIWSSGGSACWKVISFQYHIKVTQILWKISSSAVKVIEATHIWQTIIIKLCRIVERRENAFGQFCSICLSVSLHFFFRAPPKTICNNRLVLPQWPTRQLPMGAGHCQWGGYTDGNVSAGCHQDLPPYQKWSS